MYTAEGGIDIVWSFDHWLGKTSPHSQFCRCGVYFPSLEGWTINRFQVGFKMGEWTSTNQRWPSERLHNALKIIKFGPALCRYLMPSQASSFPT